MLSEKPINGPGVPTEQNKEPWKLRVTDRRQK
jgi:hypothetical protein